MTDSVDLDDDGAWMLRPGAFIDENGDVKVTVENEYND